VLLTEHAVLKRSIKSKNRFLAYDKVGVDLEGEPQNHRSNHRNNHYFIRDSGDAVGGKLF